MPVNLQPVSVQSAVVLPSTGSHSKVLGSLAYGIYSTNAFVSGAVDQVAYVYNKLGGNVLDLEITPENVYNAYEEACLEYSYLINTHQAKNVLSDMLGATTGSFNEDGEFSAYAGSDGLKGKPNLKFPRLQLKYTTHVGRGIGAHIGVGSGQTVYSASFKARQDQQDYDLQSIIYSASVDPAKKHIPYWGKVGKKAITIQRVYYKTPQAMWNFFGGYAIGTVGNLSTYGMYADDSTFQLVPAWQNVLQAYAFEEDLHVRASHWSFRINNNMLRIFPTPSGEEPSHFWVDFRVSEDPFDQDEDRKYGADGVNNMNTLPFPNVPYVNINSVGKQWVRRFALSLCKETLGQVRSKLATIPIPGNDITLNGPALITEAKDEQNSLRDELKAVLDEMVYNQLAEKDNNMQRNVQEIVARIPNGIYVG
ncbi:MAG TPA: hypothetical protein DEQ32_16550 [Gammaproteobacteria bacterium]|nr:hypothetical protein [Gammaproteobacteria bacterium]